MSETAIMELDPELEARLRERGLDDVRGPVVLTELLDEIEYLERVTGTTTDGYWPTNDYY